MRLRFEMSAVDGSIADVLAVEVDSEELPDEERRALHETVEAVRGGDDAGLERPDVAEGVLYHLHISPASELDPIEISYDEPTLPVDLRPLVEHLRDLAIEARLARVQRDDDPPDDDPADDAAPE